MADEAFAGLTVLDLTLGIAGPYCTKLLADFGAKVIKIEPRVGDPTRLLEPFAADQAGLERSGAFFYLNTNKESVTLDINTREGQELFRNLVTRADAVVESFAPGTMDEVGLKSDSLRSIRPGLVVTSISDFGQTGPYRDLEASNLTLSGLGGAMYTMRSGKTPDERPVKAGGYQAEYTTGLLGFIATVAGLMNSVRTGRGTSVDLGAMECVASTLMGDVSEYSYLGLSRKTNPYPIHGYPQGDAVPCRDGWISLTPGLGGTPNIAFLIGQPELEETPILADPRFRMANSDEFDALIGPWLRERDKWDITRQAQELRLAFTPVLSPGELTRDEQLKARHFFVSADHPEMGAVTYPGAPAALMGTPAKPGRAPLLGEHNREVFRSLGISDEQLATLQAKGVI